MPCTRAKLGARSRLRCQCTHRSRRLRLLQGSFQPLAGNGRHWQPIQIKGHERRSRARKFRFDGHLLEVLYCGSKSLILKPKAADSKFAQCTRLVGPIAKLESRGSRGFREIWDVNSLRTRVGFGFFVTQLADSKPQTPRRGIGDSRDEPGFWMSLPRTMNPGGFCNIKKVGFHRN